MKKMKLFLMAALALTFAACSNDDNEIQLPDQPQQAEGIPFTATISIDNGRTTRALVESSSGLEATWAVGEKVAMIHNGVCDKMTVSSVDGGVATITGTVTGSPSGGDEVTIIYPYEAADGATGNVRADVLAYQNGILTGTGGTSIAELYDVRKGTGKLNASGTSLSGTVSLANQNAIFKLTLRNIDDTDDVEIGGYMNIYNQDNEKLTTVKPAAGYTKVMYVALPTTATTLKFAVGGTDGKNYFNMASGLSLSASYYQSVVKLATVGDVIMPTGKCAKAGTPGAVAMIAYLGEDGQTGYRNGLALALEDANSGNKVQWCNQFADNCLANQYGDIYDTYGVDIDGIANTDALVTHGSHTHTAASAAKNFTGKRPASTSPWFLPTVAQWALMTWDAGSYDDLKTKAGMKSDATYWSSTEVYEQCAWSSDGDWENYKDDDRYVRACFAF